MLSLLFQSKSGWFHPRCNRNFWTKLDVKARNWKLTKKKKKKSRNDCVCSGTSRWWLILAGRIWKWEVGGGPEARTKGKSSVGCCIECMTWKLCSIIPPLCSTTQKPLHFCLSHIFIHSSEKSGLLSFYGPIKDLWSFNLVSHRAFFL